MVKIKKGNHETMVSMGSFRNIFEPLGYTLVVEKKKKVEIIEEPKVEEAKADKNKNEDLKGKNKKQED